MYLKVRYILYMVVGKPISSHRMRALVDNFKMTGKGARGIKMDIIKFLSYNMRKLGHTATGWYQEMDPMASRSGPASAAYWLRYTKKHRSRREAAVMMGKQRQINYEMIRHLIDLIYEEDLQLENMYKPKQMHAIQAVDEDESHRAAKQQQQQQHQEQMDQQSQVQQFPMYSAQLQQQQQPTYPQQQMCSTQQQQQHQQQAQVQQQPQTYPQQQVYTTQTAPAGSIGKYGPASDPPDQVVNGRAVWVKCEEEGVGCGMLHPTPRGQRCTQRDLDGNGVPKSRWAKYGGWNLEYLASLRPDVATSILKRMPMVGVKGVPPHLIEEAREEIR
jgi:hypothetical protein